MKQTTLFVVVGRAAAMPLATADAATLDSVEASKRAELLRSGVAPDRIDFERRTTEVPDAEAASVAAPVARKRGR